VIASADVAVDTANPVRDFPVRLSRGMSKDGKLIEVANPVPIESKDTIVSLIQYFRFIGNRSFFVFSIAGLIKSNGFHLINF
jgi:hypothetical protein